MVNVVARVMVASNWWRNRCIEAASKATDGEADVGKLEALLEA